MVRFSRFLVFKMRDRKPIATTGNCFSCDGLLQRESGSAIPELAIVLVLLTPLVAGLFFFGTIFWQVQVASDAVRHAARMAAHQSNFITTCQALKTLAISETSEYLGGDGYPLINRGVSWTEPPQVSFEAVNRDGLALNAIVVSLPRSHNNCLVCIGRIYDAVDIRIDANFILEGDVDITDCQ